MVRYKPHLIQIDISFSFFLFTINLKTAKTNLIGPITKAIKYHLFVRFDFITTNTLDMSNIKTLFKK